MTMRSSLFVIRLCAASLSLIAAAGTALADPFDGEKLARRWCAACHLVSSDQQRTNTDAPPFAAIAGMPGFTREGLAFFLLDPHPKMPNMSLSRSEASDLAEYIATLARKP
jgi:mono/diheme cytochrome c family protein